MNSNEYLIKKVLSGHIAVTILLTLTATLSTVINGLIVGQMLGADAMTAFGLASPMFILLGALAGVFSNGGSIRCAKHIGTGDMNRVALNFTVSTAASLISAAVYAVLCFLGADVLATALGGEGNIETYTADYIKCIGIAAVPFLLLQNILQYLRMDNGQKISMVSMVVVIVVNAAFAVYSCSNTNLGLFGIGVAMALGNLLGLVAIIPHFMKKDRILRFSSLKGFKEELRDICTAGLPTAINRGSQTIKNLVLNSLLLSFSGTMAVLALSVQTNVYQFLISVSTGYGLIVAMMCGIFYGEKDRGAIDRTLRVSIRSGFIVSMVIAVILFIFAEPIASMFIKDGGDLEMAARCLRLFAFSQPTSTVCLCFLYMYQTMGNLLLSNVLSLTRGALYVILVSVLLAPVLGLDGVWISFFMADVLSMLTMVLVIWKKTGRFPRRLEDFVISKEDYFDAEVIFDVNFVNDMSEVEGISSRIDDICMKNGVDEGRSHKVALCIEEMAGNVIQYAFPDKKKHYISIRIVKDNGDILFRMRDDGIRFNPITADLENHLGIKVVRGIAKSIDYRYTVRLNNLTVRL